MGDDLHLTSWRNTTQKTVSLYDEIICPKEAIHDRKVLDSLGESFDCFVAAYGKDGKLLNRFYYESSTDAERSVFDEHAQLFAESEAFKEVLEQCSDPHCIEGLPASVLYQHVVINGDATDSFYERIIIPVPEYVRSDVALFALFRVNQVFEDADYIGCVYVRTLFALLDAVLQKEKSEALSNESMNETLRAMTHYEILSLREILRVINGNEGTFIGVDIARALSCSRSIIVQAVKKMAISGVLDATSMGMRGTHIKILKPSIRENIEKYV